MPTKKTRKKTPVITVRGLTVHGAPDPILRDIDWSVKAGEHWVILGANGSGKTSLLSAITGYMTPGAGDISVLGETYGEYDWRILRKSVGLVGASVDRLVFDENTAAEVVSTGREAQLHRWGDLTPARKKEAVKFLKKVECDALADRPWRALSQGERRRVLIARALLAAPKLLILDEPCAGLDPVARENFLSFVSRLGARPGSPTLVFVTHHVEEIAPVFSHALLIRGGRVLASGPKKSVITTPLLSKAFNASIRVREKSGRYTLIIRADKTVAA